MLMADGFDDAVIGLGRRCGQPDLVVYSVEKCVQILTERDGMDKDDALESLEFNAIGAWVGESTPMWVHLMGADEIQDLAEVAESEQSE